MLRKVRRLHSSALTYFMAVAEEGSFRAASRRLSIAPSAVNRHVLLLEEELGVQLFERTPAALRLSAAGEVVRRHCFETLRSFERVNEALDALRGIHTGIVRIAASESLAADFVPTLCSDFSGRYPGVDLRVEVSSSAGVAAMIEADEVDVGLAFEVEEMRSDRLVAGFDLPVGGIVGAHHPLAGRSAVTIAECFEYPVVFPDGNLSYRRKLDAVSDLFTRPHQPGIGASSPRLMVGVARLNGHVAFMTPLGIGQDLARGDLKFLPLADPGLQPDRCVLLASFGLAQRFAARRLLELAATALQVRVAESIAAAVG